MATNLKSLLKLVPFRRKGNAKGSSATGTFNPNQTDRPLSAPGYRDHLTDIFNTRLSSDSRALLKSLFKQDPDISATVNAYLTTANTELFYVVRDFEGVIDRDGQKMLDQIIQLLTSQFDYTLGFQLKPTLDAISEEMRYMILLHGAIMAELVYDPKTLTPSEIRQVDPVSIEWIESEPGKYKPQQKVPGQNEPTKLDIPNFFVEFFRRDPTQIYTFSNFVAAINTIAARQQVINDLYRIMQINGYPRVDISIVEEILRKNAPANIQADEAAMKTWMSQRMNEMASAYANLRPDQAWVHTDATEVKITNEKNPAASLDISKVIEVLNGQNQAALKVMATIIGRGESGVNTASVEARIFAMNADELNGPVARMLSKMFTQALRLQGRECYVECYFAKAELRPETELEPQLVMRQARLLELLSHGLIDDDEFHLRMFNRIRPDAAPELSGTGFFNPKPAGDSPSPNTDSLGRSVAAPGGKMAKSNQVKK